MRNENDRDSVEEKQTTKMEVTAPIEVNSGLIGSSPPSRLIGNIIINNLNFVGLSDLISTLFKGIKDVLEMILKFILDLFNILLHHPKLLAMVLFIILVVFVGCLPIENIKALTEFVKSLPTIEIP